MATTITKKPGLTVSNLGAPVRESGNRKMTATWKTPKDLVNANKNNRAEGLEIDWFLGIPGKDPKRVTTTGNEKLTSSTINLNSLKIGKKTYNRNSFYPITNKKLSYVTVKVVATNKKGKGKAAKATRNFEVPRKPSIDAISFDSENGRVSTTVRTDAGADYKERYDTRYKVTVKNVRTGKTWDHSDSSSTSTEFNLSYDVPDYRQLSTEEYIQVTFSAWARGYAGDSDPVSRTFYVSYPSKTTIVGVDVPSKNPTENCIIRIKTNSTTEHPVDKIELEYAANVTYTNPNDIPTNEWVASGVVDNGNSSALAIAVGNLLPSTNGRFTWVRVKSTHASVLYRYSDAIRVKELETPAPTATDDDIKILSATAGEDGSSAEVLLGWNADGQDDATGTELSWSNEENTWKSTKEPNKYNFTWSDGPITYEGVNYRDSARITIKDLNEGERYFIRARRYLDGEITSYSPYSNASTVIASEIPETLVSSCDRYISDGDSLNVRWTFLGNGLQKSWQIIDSFGVVIADGEGSLGSTQISAERIRDFAVNNELQFTVQISTGSGFVESELNAVTIIDTPTLSINANNTLTAQPFMFTATTNMLCDLIVIVTSQGASGQFPQGYMMQTAGDTIFSDVIAPIWSESNDMFTANIELPGGLDFWDLGNYTLLVTAVDRVTALRSDDVPFDFTIAWANQAVDPTEAITLIPIDEIDENYHRQAVQINLTPPNGSSETDVYDIYRMDGDVVRLIGESFPLTHSVIDEYAPFGNDVDLFYRIALRTVDGDIAFIDVEYEAPSKTLRLDWAEGTLEFPYSIVIGDSYKKDFEIRHHMDGSSNGYWNPNISRTASLKTDIIKIVQPDDIRLTRQLARYAGPVFVRTPNGSAYEADVQVSDMSIKNEAVTAVAIDVTEVGLTQEYLLPIPFVLEEEQ